VGAEAGAADKDRQQLDEELDCAKSDPPPSIDEINAQEEFEAVEITEDEFNQAAWDSARPTASV